MTFLPIVERELRVSARKRGTYWSRVAVALISTVIGGCIFLPNFDKPETVIGPMIFLGLSILGFCYCLLAGRRFTVDCLSGEKREGTLGLLFLTDLKGHDVVLGKLAATSLNGFFSLLALLPVLAVPLMMGGISNSQFWRMALVLVSTFFFSLAIGIYASAAHRTINRAAGTNLGLMFLFALAIPFLALFTVHYFLPSPRPSLIPWPAFSTSPIFAFVFSFDPNYRIAPSGFWCSMATINALTCLLIYRAARIVPHSWQDRLTPPPQISPPRTSQRSLSCREAAKRSAYRKRLLDINAFYWLAARDRRKPLWVWLFLVFASVWWIWGWLGSGDNWFDISVAVTSAFILNTTLKFWIALEAGQRLAEDKKSGALELLLSSSLTDRDIVRGQWLALRRQFLWPTLTIVILEFLFLWPNAPFGNTRSQLFICLAAGALMLVADMLTLFLVAVYQALAARSPAYAASLTVLFVMFLPGLVLILLVAATNIFAEWLEFEGPGWKFWLAVWVGLGLATDLLFGLIAWRKLQTNFRQLAAGRFSPEHSRAA